MIRRSGSFIATEWGAALTRSEPAVTDANGSPSPRGERHGEKDPGGDGAERVDRRRTRWDEHRRARREELVRAALVTIRRYGAEVGMDTIAAQAGTSKAGMYRYFGSKSGLYLAVCQRVADLVIRRLRLAMAAVDGPREKFAAAIEEYLRLIESDVEVYRFVMQQPAGQRPTDQDPIAGIGSLLGEQVAEILATQLRRARGPVEAAVPWGHGLVGLVRSAADDWVRNSVRMPRPVLCEHLTDLAWSGLTTKLRRGRRG